MFLICHKSRDFVLFPTFPEFMMSSGNVLDDCRHFLCYSALSQMINSARFMKMVGQRIVLSMERGGMCNMASLSNRISVIGKIIPRIEFKFVFSIRNSAMTYFFFKEFRVGHLLRRRYIQSGEALVPKSQFEL